jgi:CheY-like chemotaxis protein
LVGKKILLIEDSPDTQAFVSTIARLEGASLAIASTAEQALEILERENAFDLIVLDVNLPGADGWDVLEYLRQIPGDPPPVVVFTAFVDLSTRERAAAMGAAGVVVKPIGARDLVESLNAFLD